MSAGIGVTHTLADVARLTGRALGTVYGIVHEMKLDLVEVPSTRRAGELVKAVKHEDLEALCSRLQRAKLRKAKKQPRPAAVPTAAAASDVLGETIRILEAQAEKHEALAEKLREAVEWIKA